MSMHNLIECSKRYRKTTGSLWNYYRDELSDDDDTNDNNEPKKNMQSTQNHLNTRQVLQGVLTMLM